MARAYLLLSGLEDPHKQMWTLSPASMTVPSNSPDSRAAVVLGLLATKAVVSWRVPPLTARRTPTGSETFRATEPPQPGATTHAELISPLAERKLPVTERGPYLGWTLGATTTSANAGAAGLSPTRCFHIHSPMPPHKKIYIIQTGTSNERVELVMICGVEPAMICALRMGVFNLS